MSEDLLTALRRAGIADLLPAEVERLLAALELQGAPSPTVAGDLETIAGTAVAAAGATLPGLTGLPLGVPDLPGSLPVQVSVQSGGAGSPRWAVDLDLDPLTVPFPGLRPAQEVVQPGRATVLVETAGAVRVVGRGALRISAAGGATPRVSLLDGLHPADPFGPHGAVPGLSLEPASFFVGASEFGFTVEDLGWDEAGLTLRRATLYLPPGAPVVGDVSAAVENLFLGSPVGVKGTATAQFGGHGEPPPAPQFEVEVEVAWDDPAARGLAEAVPSRAEATVRWPGDHVALPGGGSAPIAPPGGGAPPEWKLRGSWGHDRAGGSDEFTLALDVAGSPDGIAAVAGAPLAGALGLAPAVLGSAPRSNGDATLVRALVEALGAAAATGLLRPESRVVVAGLEIDRLQRAGGSGSRTRLIVDYTVELSFEVDGAGLPLQVRTRSGKPMRLRYRGVRADVDTAAQHWYEGVSLSFDGAIPEVLDPGSWQLGPPLDDLLRVLGVRSGAGSGWLEVDLAMAADLGVVKLSTATVRVVFGGGGIEGVELRGLRAGVDVAEVVSGEGSLDVGNQAIHAGLQLDVVPLKLAALADLVLGEQGFVELEVGARFAAPLPFANSGLGLFGVVGRFVSNGRREVPAGSDPVDRELKWLAAEPVDKYKPEAGQYAMGLGAVVGTVADAGFTFHAQGMVTVEFPRPAVIFSVIAEILKRPAPVPEERVGKPGAGLSIIGLIVIDEEGVSIALRGHYELPHLLIVDIPVGAWFPFEDPTASWVHVGTDGLPERGGAPVTMTLLPGILDQRVWAFAMVHGHGISPGLMGKSDFAFEGFSIGFGAGWEIDWSAGPIRLQASALVLAGFGANPLRLAAGIWVRGSLDLVVVSISARGEITLLTNGEQTKLHGKFCGEVDLFFFSLSGCVGITIGPDIGDLGPPQSPLAGVDLVSRRGYATAAAVREGTGAPPRVWPDAIPVLHFSHIVDAAGAAGDFKIGEPMPGPVWSGSRELKYAYRITGVRLEALDGSPFAPPLGTKFDSAWWWPGVRSKTEPSAQLAAKGVEARHLALLSWEPWKGMLPLTEPDASPADPGAPLREVCEPVRRADPVCIWGQLGRASGAGAATLVEPAETAAAARRAPSRLRLSQPGDADWDDVLAAAGAQGIVVTPTGVVPLDQPFIGQGGEELREGWQLAGLAFSGTTLGTLAAGASFDPPLEDASLALEICRGVVQEGMEGEKIYSNLSTPIGCTALTALDPERLAASSGADGSVRWSGMTFAGGRGEPLEAVEGDEGWGLQVPGAGLRVGLPSGVWIATVGFAAATDAWLIALDSGGTEIASASGEGVTELTIEASGIAALVVHGKGAVLERVCTPDSFGVSTALLRPPPLLTFVPPPGPVVVGTHADGSEHLWESTVVAEDKECAQAVYRGPDPGPWRGVRLGPVRGHRVKVIGACGVRWQEAVERRRAEAGRLELIEALTVQATGAAGTKRAVVTPAGPLPLVLLGPPPRPLFAADKAYRVAVDWEWQAWKPGGGTVAEPDPDKNAWKKGGTDSFEFATAPARPTIPVDLTGEGSFDPRGVARYVAGAEPSGELPHLLDDPIRIRFSVDYLPALLHAYGYETRIEVHPTDVAPGSLHLDPRIKDLVVGIDLVTWLEGTLRPTEQVVVGAVAASDCTPDTSLGGLAAEVKANLEPETAYDLTLRARPQHGEDSVVSRFHFRTSRYRDVGELLAAFGLLAGGTPGEPPPDVLLTSWSQPAAAPFDDFALQTALGALHLDPWPLAAEPRATTLWLAPSGEETRWSLAAVLLEAPEPVARAGRIRVSGSVGAAGLEHRLGTANGTRVMLTPAAPFPPAPDDLLTVRLDDDLRSTGAEGSVALLGAPGTIRSELG
ncbi:MAG TPA: hypothetical protein VFX35_02895 [Solirubrobacterales bacterium]|nr:hypothetical protein [Solirubrobacterales bacterium]